MVPIRLTLRNFMSYGDEPETLDFAGVQLACLSGDNGNGKSALLDAMTWALWGKTRASGSQSSGDDDLVRLGADDMEVAFEFLLGDEHYRVVRKRSRRTRSGDWQLFLREATGAWRPAGGPGMRETEKCLAGLLRMDYETFINSAYIQQGKADAFTRQKPDDRKRILADILDLARYDVLERMAREHRGEADLRLSDLDGELRHLEARVREEAELRQRLEEHQAALARWSAEKAKRDGELAVAHAEQAAAQEKAQRLREREERLREVESELADREAEAARLRAKMAADAEVLAERPAILGRFARLCELRALAQRLEPEVAALRTAERDAERVRGQLKVRHQELLGALRLAESEWRQVEERRLRMADLERRLADLAPKLEHLAQAEQRHAVARSELASAQQAFADLQAQHKRVTGEIEELVDVLQVLQEPRPACPVCQSDLSGGKREAVYARQEQKRRALAERQRELKRDGAACKQQRDRLEGEFERLEAQLRGAAALRAQSIEWQRALTEAAAQNENAGELAARRDELRRRVEVGDYGADERMQLTGLEREVEHLQSALRDYAGAQQELRTLADEQVERRHAQLEEAERAQERDRGELARIDAWCAKRRQQVMVERDRQASLRTDIAGLAGIVERAAEAELAAREATAQCDAAREDVARGQNGLDDCARARAQVRERQAERERVAHDKQAYTDLAAAFGRKGVQALIIDNVLPDIQDEANRLLARLTDNAMQVALHTQRDLRSRAGQAETLDIRITDDSGTRPYEMYSGGEAFRVNLALRIALSRLLARRAGARLQTLIIDEGFGTQDAKGRERLVEAIEAIRDEFAMILVISHIEDLKDAFPTRIEVSRTPSGSRITVLD